MIAVVALLAGGPVFTLLAAAYQMATVGGDGLRPRAVVAVAPAPAAPTPRAQAVAAATGAGQTAQSGVQSAPGPAAEPVADSAGQSGPQAQPAAGGGAHDPVPGRSAQDFSAYRPVWEPLLAQADPGRGGDLAASGRPQDGVQACAACHGSRGVAPAGGAFPNLAGLSAEYIAKQLSDYRDGSRTHPLMQAIAKGLADEDLGHLAAYYGSLDAPAAAGPAAGGQEGAQQARRLDELGENARALPACANCHGPGGRGEGAMLPRLAGQPQAYFIAQMRAFRQGQRRNDDVGVMRALAQRLTPAEIDALAGYYAGQAAAHDQPGQAGER